MIRSKADDNNATTYAISDVNNNSMFFACSEHINVASKKNLVRQMANEMIKMLEDEEILKEAKQWMR